MQMTSRAEGASSPLAGRSMDMDVDRPAAPADLPPVKSSTDARQDSHAARNRIPADLQPWFEARRKFRLSDATVQMARELGLNPQKLGKLAATGGSSWKAPLPDFIARCYERAYKRTRPAEPRSLEQVVADRHARKAAQKARKLQRHAENGPVDSPKEARMTEHPIAAWHRIVKDRSVPGLNALLDEEAVFISPVVHTPQRGKKLAMMYLAAAFEVFANPTFRYVREIVGGSDAMLEFETEIDGVLVNGVDIIKWNDAGRIVEFKVMVRPLKAIQLIHQKMAAMLQAGR